MPTPRRYQISTLVVDCRTKDPNVCFPDHDAHFQTQLSSIMILVVVVVVGGGGGVDFAEKMKRGLERTQLFFLWRTTMPTDTLHVLAVPFERG